MLGVALWPQADNQTEEVVSPPLLRQTKPSIYLPPRDWYARLVAKNLAELPLYGQLLGFEIIQSIEVGKVGLVELVIPQHTDPARIWPAMLADGGILVQAVMVWYPDLEGIYVWFGFELSDCQDGCVDHLYPAYLTYVDVSQASIVWPFPGAILINSYSWWDPHLFKNRGGDR
jgi:hypothetical protein